MQMITTYLIPFALVLIGGQIGGRCGHAFWGSVAGFAVALLYLSFVKRGEIAMAKGTRALKSGDIKGGLALYDKALKSPLSSDYLLNAAYVYLRYGKENRCLETLSLTESKGRLSTAQQKELYNIRGICLWRRGDFSGAEAQFRLSHDLGADAQTYSHLGFILVEEKKLDEAYAFNKEAMAYNDSDASIADNMAMCHFLRGELDEALALYETIMESGTRFPVIYYNYALCLEKKGRLEDAKEQLECALHYPYSHIAAVSRETVEKKYEELSLRIG